MEIFTLLETIEDMLENSKEVPFTHKAIIDKEEVLDIIKEIRLKLPEELKQSWMRSLYLLLTMLRSEMLIWSSARQSGK